TPPHALSRAAPPARSVRVARSHARSRRTGLSPSDSLTRSLARPLRRRAPFPPSLKAPARPRRSAFGAEAGAWLARTLARDVQGFRPRTPLHARSQALVLLSSVDANQAPHEAGQGEAACDVHHEVGARHD